MSAADMHTLADALRWALRRIETAKLGEGDYFEQAESILADADAALDRLQTEAYAEGRRDELVDAATRTAALERRIAELENDLENHDTASKAIDAWCTTHRKQVPWTKCIDIIAIVTRMPEKERHRLQALGDEQASADVLAERRRQVDAEGFTPEHDDIEHGENHALPRAAICYADIGRRLTQEQHDDIWPWGVKWWKPEDPRRSLVKAAALLIAEIERLDRRAAIARAEGKA